MARRAAKRQRMRWRTGARTWWGSCSAAASPFEAALQGAGFPLRHLEQDVIVPMYRTSVECTPVGPFAGPMVVSMRPIRPTASTRPTKSRLGTPRVHGAPVHAGDPQVLGIADIASPDWGDPVKLESGRGAGVLGLRRSRPRPWAQASRPPLMITHAPGHMFLTDWRDHELAGDAPALA